MNNDKKIFVILALGFLGDTILIEPLCQNIKNNCNNSKIIVIANNIFMDIVKGFKSVDEVYGYDKQNKHKGILGYLKFNKEFPYKNKIDYAIITHPHERSILAAKVIGAKNIVSLPVKGGICNYFINQKIKYSAQEIRNTYKADYNLKYIEQICETTTQPVKYERNDINYQKIKEKFSLPDKYVVLSPTSKDLIKDWEYKDIKDFIEKEEIAVVLVGTKKANKIANKLKEENIKFIDLSNKTTIEELGAVIKMAEICISVDTGTFHFSYSQGVRTIGLFFNSQMVKEWAPTNLDYVKLIIGEREQISKKINYIKNITADDVIKEIERFSNV